MNKERFFGCFKVSALLLAAMVAVSCTPGGGAPTRKKMPAFNSVSGFEGPMPFEGRNSSSKIGAGGFAFTTGNVDLMLNGNLQEFVSVALPSAANDSLAVNLVNSFKPLALPLLSSWAQQQRHGVVIDLSNHNDAVYRTDYMIEKTGEFSIPVVVMWDAAASGRVKLLKSMIANVPAVSFSCTSGIDPANK